MAKIGKNPPDFTSLTLEQLATRRYQTELRKETTQLDGASAEPNARVDYDEFRQLSPALQQEYLDVVNTMKEESADARNGLIKKTLAAGGGMGLIAAHFTPLLPAAVVADVVLAIGGLVWALDDGDGGP